MCFWKNESGNVAMMLALSILPVMMLITISIEFNRQQTFERQASAALDATVLATIRNRQDEGTDGVELSDFAQTYFEANAPVMDDVTYMPVVMQDTGDEITLSVQASMPSAMLGIFGAESFDFDVSSSAVAGGASRLEMILVLDVSGSMAGEKTEGLRRAAQDLITLIINSENPDARIGIVPFNNYVNVGLNNRDADWISVADDGDVTTQSCTADMAGAESAGCTVSQSCSSGGASAEGGEVCTTTISSCNRGVDSNDFLICTEQVSERVWHGCVGSRPDPLFLEDGDYANNPILGQLQPTVFSCEPENAIVELTNDAALLNRTLDGLIPSGTTYMATGLLWGARALSPQAPFDTASFSGTPGAQAIVLLSDGRNTRGRNASSMGHESPAMGVSDEDTVAACETIRDNGVTLYTIDFGVDDVGTEQLLRDCATSIDFAFEANNTNQLISVFNAIGSSFREVALSR